jgi:hypothetical protein
MKKKLTINLKREQNRYVYVFSTEAYIKPMLEAIWSPLLASLSINLEESEDNNII